MPNQITTKDLISVHGRGSLKIEWKAQDANKKQIDVSDRIVFFEVDGVPIREQLVQDPNDPLGLVVLIERTQVANLRSKPTRCALIDETDIEADLPFVIWDNRIVRVGYVGVPDDVDDA